MSFFEFILLFVASFRMTRLIVFDQITSFIRNPFIKEIEEVDEDGTAVEYIEIKGSGIRALIGELLSCYWCTGIWSSLFLYFGYILYPFIFEPVVIILAIAGCAAIIEVMIQRIID